MRRCKRLIAVLCALTLLFGMTELPAFAAGSTVTAETSASIRQGDYGYCYVFLDSLESLAAVNIAVHFDPAKIRAVDTYNSVNALMYENQIGSDNVQYSYIFDGAGTAGSVRLFYFLYQVLSDAPVGADYFDIIVSDAYDNDLNDLQISGSRRSFTITEAVSDKNCLVYGTGAVSTKVEEEFSLTYSFSTNEIASGSFELQYDPELFQVVSVAGGKFLDGKYADINTELTGSVYGSFAGTEYSSDRQLMTVTFRTLQNTATSSAIKLAVSELCDLDLNSISCSGCSSTVTVAHDPSYTETAPAMKLTPVYTEDGQVIATITLEENSRLGAGDFTVTFDPEMLTYVSAEKGFSPSFFTVNERKTAEGILKFSIISTTDITDAQTVLTVTFDAKRVCLDTVEELPLTGSGLVDSMTEAILLNFVSSPVPLPGAGHMEVTDAAVEATCTETGLTEGSHCSACGQVFTAQQITEALGHSITEYVSNGDATCTADGTKTATCNRCGETDTATDVGSVLGHSFTNYVSNGDATCTADGTKTAKCDRCEETDTVADPGSALGHTEVVDSQGIAPGCMENGVAEAKHCTVCGEVTATADMIPALGHTDQDGDSLCDRCGYGLLGCGTCGDSLVWAVGTDGVLTVAGIGDMYIYSYSNPAPWSTHRSSIAGVVIQNGVTSIGEYAFYNYSNITSITMGDDVVSIGSSAFTFCPVESITLGKSVASIGHLAFDYCRRLTAIYVDDENATYADVDGILYDQAVTTLIKCPPAYSGAITLPDSVSSIGSDAFYQCDGLTAICAGDENAAYADVDGILYDKAVTTLILCPTGYRGVVTVPGSVSSIDSDAFEDCDYLTAIHVDEENATYADVDGILYDKAMTTLILCPYAYRGAVHVPDTVITLSDRAFYFRSGVTEVTLSANLETIGEYVFYYCRGLKSLVIPAGVESIGNRALSSCNYLESVTFEGTTPPSLHSYAFSSTTTTAYYPCDGTWTEDLLQNYHGTITWEQYHTYEGGICTRCSELDPVPSISSASLVLGGILELNIKVHPAGSEEYALWAAIGKDALQPVNGSGNVYTVKLPIHRLHEGVKLEFMVDGQLADTKTWTMTAYSDSLREEYAGNAKMMRLLDTLAACGNYAAYFAEPAGTAPGNSEAEAVTQAELKAYKLNILTPNKDLGAVAALYLDDACDLTVKFNAAAWEGNTLYINGKAVAVTEADNRMIYEISELLPQDWDTMYAIEVKNTAGETVFACNYSVLSYAYTCLGKAQEAETGLNGLLKAMFLYSMAANNYQSP